LSLKVILAVAVDSWLLASSSIAWESAGFIVRSTVSISEAIQHFKSGDFDLVLLGHSLTDDRKERLTFLIRSTGSRTPVVSITKLPGACDSFADETIGNNSGAILQIMQELLANESIPHIGREVVHGGAI
jgi:DNA-binding response OmpR family regulator